MFSYGHRHMAEQKQDDQLEPTYKQLCEDTECNPDDLPEAMNERDEWQERIRDIRAGGTTWWWWSWSYICQQS